MRPNRIHMTQHKRVLAYWWHSVRANRWSRKSTELAGSEPLPGKSVFKVHSRGGLADLDQFGDGDRSQGIARFLRFLQIEFDHGASRLVQLSHRLAGFEMNNRLLFHRFVCLAEAKNRNIKHVSLSCSGRDLYSPFER